jgi:hypothetical protein
MNFDYEIFLNDSLIAILPYSGEDFDIEIQEFWNYVKSRGLHEYCNDYFDASERDGHGQQEGKYSFEEYFNLSHAEIKTDLEKYLSLPKFKKNI